MGGFRLALESYGAKCVFSSDIDKNVSRTYRKNFGDDPLSDITKVDEKDIVKGREILAAEWILVAQKYNNIFRWVLKPINVAINHYGEGNVEITNRGNLKIGRITMQRKGGDGGRQTANMLQFKVNPIELFNVN